jgi:hypothetical protein
VRVVRVPNNGLFNFLERNLINFPETPQSKNRLIAGGAKKMLSTLSAPRGLIFEQVKYRTV